MQHTNDLSNPSVTQCCVPTICHVNEPIHMDDLNDCVKVICNNDHCDQGRYMHKTCFEAWEQTVLTYLRSTGRARSWSEKQRLQNLWTKKGYDLAYRACGCKCKKGHLKKDLDWTAPISTFTDGQCKKKKNRKKKVNEKPTLINGSSTPIAVNNSKPNNMPISNGITNGTNNGTIIPMTRLRTSSMSSTGSVGSGGTSPPFSGSESQSPGYLNQSMFMKKFFCEQNRRERHSSGLMFPKRQDYSSFNNLPSHKINSYHIKTEDDVNHGNDETRCFILSTLSANHINRISCMLCDATMLIFEKYPLIDGTFFLSPQQHQKYAVPCLIEGRPLYLNAVCMGCLEGWNVSLKCKSCSIEWSGSELILGSMYSYDIFAAVPCCAERLRCKNCHRLVISPDRCPENFSDYSHSIPCAHCGIVDYHFAKPISAIYSRSDRRQ